MSGAEAPTPPRNEATAGPFDEQQWVGRLVEGRYRILRKLGEGGMGAVFLAEHLKLHKQVALKVVHPEFAALEEMAERFAREARASALLDHPHVVAATDYGTLSEGGAFLVMQLVRGSSLKDMLQSRGALPWPRAVEVAAQIADALAAAHAAGIVHRDVKPDNVLVEEQDDGSWHARLLDFGIARLTEEGDEPRRQLTRVGTVMGTPGYMPPEQALGEVVDSRADLYALGVLLWEACTGHEPFGDLQDLSAIVARQLTEAPPPPEPPASHPALPPALRELLGRLLAGKPEARPESAARVRDTLRALLREAPSADLARAATLWRAPSGSDSSEPDGPAGRYAALHRWRRALRSTVRVAGRPWPLWRLLAAGAVPIGLLLAAWLFWAAGDTATPSETSGPAGALRRAAERLRSEPPPEVQRHVETLLQASKRRARREAALWLLSHEPAEQVPNWVRAGAAFEVARGCQARRRALQRIRAQGDPRLLPLVERYHRAPRRGCGLLGSQDCYDCIRKDLRETVRALGGDPDPPSRSRRKRRKRSGGNH